MKKTGLLNQPISNVIAGMGHMDELTIGDAGLPIPKGPERIDLAVQKGIPAFMDVLNAVLSEMAIEEVVVAEEFEKHSPELYQEVMQAVGRVTVRKVVHDRFKHRTMSSKAVIRTGEFTPYANIILVAGVVF